MSSQPEFPKTQKAIQVSGMSAMIRSRAILIPSRRTDLKLQISRTGGLEVIEENEVPVPTPKDNEVLIKVQWT